MSKLDELVAEFAQSVSAQTNEIMRHGGSARVGNQYAKRQLAAFDALCVHGNTGRDALAVLFMHPRLDVRVAAAAFLLRHRTAEAKAVLQEAAKGKGLVPFEAQETLKRWEDGTWALDPG